MVDVTYLDIAKIGGGVILGGLIIYLREYFILSHEYELKVVNDRIDEFLQDSKRYFEPIALASGDLSLSLKISESEEKIREQPEIPFYWLAKYLYQRNLLRDNTFFYFPKDEVKILKKYGELNKVIGELFDYNKRHISKITSYYSSNKEYNVFCDKLSSIADEFEIFKNKISQENCRKKLIEVSWDFSKLVIEAISIAYEPWYRQYMPWYKKIFKRAK